MSDWNYGQYLKFKNQRTQPAIDLAVRVMKYRPKTIVDIGCGPGNSTAVLKDIFPDADMLGVDSSADMIARAKHTYNDLSFLQSDARSLAGRYDLMFSNACLQWIHDHDTLIPLLMEKLNDNGVLAVQIPMNGGEPLFRLIKEIAAQPKWGFEDKITEHNETLAPDEYFNILSACASSFEIWETKYYHSLPDHRALVEWVKDTRIRPYLDRLNDEQGIEFENEILKAAKDVYPIMKNGEVVLGFRRFFFTAVK